MPVVLGSAFAAIPPHAAWYARRGYLAPAARESARCRELLSFQIVFPARASAAPAPAAWRWRWTTACPRARYGSAGAGDVDFRIDDVRTGQLTIANDGLHGGGDDALMADFLRRTLDRRRHGTTADAATALEVPIESHLRPPRPGIASRRHGRASPAAADPA